jgi:hypothetical protein
MADERVGVADPHGDDGNPAHLIAICEIQRRENLAASCKPRISHSENNLIEQDHRASSVGQMTSDTSVHSAVRMRSAQSSSCTASSRRLKTSGRACPVSVFPTFAISPSSKWPEAGASDATLMAFAGHTSRRMPEHYTPRNLAAKHTALEKTRERSDG